LQSSQPRIYKLYFDLWHKSSVGVVSLLFLVLYRSNKYAYEFSQSLSLYTVALIVFDVGLYQYIFKASGRHAKLLENDNVTEYLKKIWKLYLLKICTSLSGVSITGFILVRQGIGIHLIISLSAWALLYQLTAQPLLTAKKDFKSLFLAALLSQLIVVIVFAFAIVKGKTYVLHSFIYYPAILSASSFLFTWIQFSRSTSLSFSLRANLIDLTLDLLRHKPSFRSLTPFFKEISLIWINTVATILLYQTPIYILSMISGRNIGSFDPSNAPFALELPLIYVKINAIVFSLFQYLSQYSIVKYANKQASCDGNALQELQSTYQAFKVRLLRSSCLISGFYFVLFLGFICIFMPNPSWRLEYFILIILSPLCIYTRMQRIFINKILVVYAKAMKRIVYSNIISVISAIMLFWLSYVLAVRVDFIVAFALITVIGLLFDLGFASTFNSSLNNLVRQR
jgi:hypothetical protein